MATPWTTDQIHAIAPDAASAKAGKGLAAPRKWSSLGSNERAAWGECQGSGKEPYRTQIDFRDSAFKCSCPSRKFPCKHALGLLFLLDANAAKPASAELPEWVAEWLASRDETSRKRAERTERAAAVPDPEARSKRAVERRARVEAGVADLELWLRDLVRNGLASAHAQGYGFWEAPAARLVDAQAPGLARMVRELAGLASSGEGWEERLLDRVGRIYLLVEAFRGLDELPEATRFDVETRVGWTRTQEEVAVSGEAVRDRWTVLGQAVEDEERVRVQRTWISGASSRRAAAVLSFAAVAQSLDASLLPGTAFDGEVVFYPGASPLRAIVRERSASAPPADFSGYDTAAGALSAFARALASDPWIERFPVALGAAWPVRRGEAWSVRDREGGLLDVSRGFAGGWRLLSLSGGRPVGLFGEWDGETLSPLAAWRDGRFVAL